MRTTHTAARLVLPALFVGAASVIASPGSATATVTNLVVAKPSTGSAYGTGCTYDVSAAVDANGNHPVLVEGGATNDLVVLDVQNTKGALITFKWTPKAEGVRLIGIRQDGNYKLKTVTVKKGINTGSSCFAL